MAHLGVGGFIQFRREAVPEIVLRADECQRGTNEWLPPRTGLLTGDQVSIAGRGYVVGVNELGYHSLYTDLAQAFEGAPEQRVPLQDLLVGGECRIAAGNQSCFCSTLVDWTLYQGRASIDLDRIEEQFGEAIASLACSALVGNFFYDLPDSAERPHWRICQEFELTGKRATDSADCFLRLCDGAEPGTAFGYRGVGVLAEIAINSRHPSHLAGTVEAVFLEAPRLSFSSEVESL